MKILAVVCIMTFLFHAVFCEDDQTIALKFLNQYGYISSTRSGNHDVSTAIRKFQQFFGLKVSGTLDASTVNLMKKSRCGVPDETDERRMRRYLTVSKWSKTHLTYYVQPGQDLPHTLQRQIFSDALQFWADVSSLTFREVNIAVDADIKISFGRHSHNGTNVEKTCPYPFNGPGGVLAHAYYPQDGRAHFDEDETYTHNSGSGVNLLWVAVHEFGHSLGLYHTGVQGAIMYPFYTGYVPNMQLHSDDIAGIQSLYGSNTAGSGGGVETSAPTQAPTPAPTGSGGEVQTSAPTQASTSAPTGSGNCHDIAAISDCQDWKDAGFCQAHYESLTYWCPKTCHSCSNPGNGGGVQTSAPYQAPSPAPTDSDTLGSCNDVATTSECKGWKDAGLCQAHNESLTYWCPKTCYNCNP